MHLEVRKRHSEPLRASSPAARRRDPECARDGSPSQALRFGAAASGAHRGNDPSGAVEIHAIGPAGGIRNILDLAMAGPTALSKAAWAAATASGAGTALIILDDVTQGPVHPRLNERTARQQRSRLQIAERRRQSDQILFAAVRIALGELITPEARAPRDQQPVDNPPAHLGVLHECFKPFIGFAPLFFLGFGKFRFGHFGIITDNGQARALAFLRSGVGEPPGSRFGFRLR